MKTTWAAGCVPRHVRRELVVIGCGRKLVWSGDAKFWSCLPGCFEHAGEGVKGATGEVPALRAGLLRE